MALKFIQVTDMTTEKDEGNYRKTNFSFNGKKDIPNSLRVSGGLSHGTVITFDRENAEKMRDFCQNILDCYDR